MKVTALTRLEKTAYFSGICTAVIGLLALLGRLTGWLLLASMGPNYRVMPLTSAIVFSALGILLCYVASHKKPGKTDYFISGVLILLMAVGLLILFGSFNLLIPALDSVAPLMGLVFSVSALGLFLKYNYSDKYIYENIIGFFGLFVLGFGLTVVLGYLFDSPYLYGGNNIPVALNGGLCDLLLGCGLIALAGRKTIVLRHLLEESVNGKIQRMIIPFTSSVVIFQSLFFIKFHRYFEEFGLSTFAIIVAAETVLFIAISVAIAARITKKIYSSAQKDQEEREKATEALRQTEVLKKQAEEKELKTEQQYRQLFEGMLEGFAFHEIIVDKNNRPVDYRFLQINPAFEKLTGIKSSVAVGKTVKEILPGIEREWIDRYGKVAITGEPVSFENYSKELDKHYQVVAFSSEKGKFAVLFSDITARKKAELAIKEVNINLEKRVTERTVELTSLNKELEAFSYSVSHDLRTPLRGIDGWSQALYEDYGEKLEKKGVEYLGFIRKEAQRMGILIDDMLKLSKISRIEIKETRVDLSQVVLTLSERLKKTAPQRKVKFIIEPGIIVLGDIGLLEIMFSNLLENSFKFTGLKEEAVIEFGKAKNKEDGVLYIKDNGAGFDMAFADKLFGAFQRMHRQSEFSGIGIGLATVLRVVNRHGGQVWAESEVNKGTVIYFKLNAVKQK